MRSTIPAWIAALAATLSACNPRSPVAYGDANSIVVVAPDSLWAEVQDTVRSVMESHVFTVRNERMFDLTHVSPTDPDWLTLRQWKHVLVIGPADAPWVAPAVGRSDADLGTLPALVDESSIWSRGQSVTALVLPDEGLPASIVETLPRLRAYYERTFRAGVRQRMFVSGADTALQDTLRAEAGFSLLLPRVYDWSRTDTMTYRFINANPVGGTLDRSILVTWREGAAPLSEAELVAWRDRLGDGVYEWGQRVDTERLRSRPLDAYADGSLEVQGVWTGTESTPPSAGPFLARAVVCPALDRTYLLDAWLYAPSKDKYEYMLQLETILDSFECGS